MFILPFGQISQAQNMDINALKAINLHRPKSLDNTFLAITNTTKPIAVVIPVSMFVAGMIKKDEDLKYNALQFAGALVVSTVITEGLKYTIHRARPYVTYPYLQNKTIESDPSFPSGHTSVAFATATSLSLNYHRWYVIAPSFLWATTVAYSRMDLGVHYPSDVLAGAIIGVASSWLSYKVAHWVNKKYHIK